VFSDNAVVYPISRNEFRNEWRGSACKREGATGTEVERDEHVEMGRECSRKCISRMPRSFRELKSVGKNAAGRSRVSGGGRRTKGRKTENILFIRTA